MARPTILVTGGAGHIGSHLIELLVADGKSRVVSLDNYFNGSRDNHIAGAEYRTGHTRDIATLVPEDVDIVYHLGEYARIATSFEDVAQVYDLNVAGTFAVVQFARARKIRKLVYAASSTKFAVEGNGPHQSPYAFTKATNVDLIRDFDRWYGLPHAICYFYNAFGPREVGQGKYATLIARFEQEYLRGEPLSIVGSGRQRRAFTYVKDLARGIALVGAKGWGDGYELGATKSYSVLQIARAFGGPTRFVEGNPGRKASEKASTKARRELGWKPTVDILDYIRDFKARNQRPRR